MILNEKKVLEELHNKYEHDKEFRNELTEFIRFYGSKLVQLADTPEKEQWIADIIEDCILGQYFHGYILMKTLIEQNELQESEIFYDQFWLTPPGTLRNEMGNVMVFQFNKDWAYHRGLDEYNLRIIQDFHVGYDVYREIMLETANFGAYKAIIENPLYKGNEQKNNETAMLLGDHRDLQFVNPQVFIQASYFSAEHEIWDIFKAANGKTEADWIGTVHLSKIPTEQENEWNYIFNVSIKDIIRMDEKNRIFTTLNEKLPNDIKERMQYRLYHLSDLEVLTYNNENDVHR